MDGWFQMISSTSRSDCLPSIINLALIVAKDLNAKTELQNNKVIEP